MLKYLVQSGAFLSGSPAGRWPFPSLCFTMMERDRYDWITWAANLSLVVAAILGVIVALVTLWKIKRQTEATEAIVKISQDTLVSTFRPKLLVRKLSIVLVQEPMDVEKRYRVEYSLINVGGTVAHVTEQEVCVHYNKSGLGHKIPQDASDTIHSRKGFLLKPGGNCEQTLEVGFEVAQRLMHLQRLLAQGLANPVLTGELFLTGLITYQDDSGVLRRAAFHRSYNPATGRFAVVEDPDYEYSD